MLRFTGITFLAQMQSEGSMSAVRPCAAGAIPAASELQVTARALSSQATMSPLNTCFKTTTLPCENPATGGGRRRRATGRGQQGLLGRSPVQRPVRLGVCASAVNLDSVLFRQECGQMLAGFLCTTGQTGLSSAKLLPRPTCPCFLPRENPVLLPLPRLPFLGGLQWAQRGLCVLSATLL